MRFGLAELFATVTSSAIAIVVASMYAQSTAAGRDELVSWLACVVLIGPSVFALPLDFIRKSPKMAIGVWWIITITATVIGFFHLVSERSATPFKGILLLLACFFGFFSPVIFFSIRRGRNGDGVAP